MPNGDYYSPDQSQQLDALLSPFDDKLRSFASSIGGNLIVGYHDLPDRMIKWIGDDSISRMIQLSPGYVDLAHQPIGSLECSVYALAWKDVPRSDVLEAKENRGPAYRLSWHSEVALFSQAELDETHLLRAVRCAQQRLEQLNEGDLSAPVR